jgi:hypothetical protein
MRKRHHRRISLIVAAVVALLATTALSASAATTTTPAPPPAPPSAYVQTSDYTDGCTDWSLQSTWPFSVANPKWVFTCTNTFWYDPSDPDAWLRSWDSYYWNADKQTAIQWQYQIWDNYLFWWDSCTFYYPTACQ